MSSHVQTEKMFNSTGIVTQKFLFEKGVDYILSFRLKELVHDSPSSDEEKEYLKQNKKKGKEKKKPGRKSNWSPEAVDDFIDIVVNDDYYKRKLIFTNTKNQKNGVIYEKILLQLKERAAKRGDILQFTVPQLRTKFKKCISDCKHVALTMKTATGIKRFQEERGFGKWFNMLFPLVKSRDSCKPELALEPSSVEQQLTKKASPDDGKEGIFIPVKKKQKVKASDKISESAIEAINVVKDTLKNDPTKDLIAFMKEELEKSREHELKLVGLMQSFRQTDAQYPPHQLPSFGGMPCNEGSSLAATNYSSWNIAIGTRVHNQPAAYHYSDVASSSIPESQSTQIHYDGKKAYQKL